jgi:hypothetical protein
LASGAKTSIERSNQSITAMSDVLERICAEIGVTLSGTGKNHAAEIVAAKVIEHAQHGVKTQTELYLATMADFKPDG